MSKAKAKQEDFAFDGDSDSDEDIEGFNQQVKKLEPNASDDGGEEDGGEDSSDEEEDDVDEDSDSSEESEDGDAKQKTLNTHLEKQSKISKLHEQLSALDKDEQSDESDDDSEDNEDESDDNEDSDEEESDDDVMEEIAESQQKDIVKKRKVEENVEDDEDDSAKKIKGDNGEVEYVDKRQKFKNKLSKMSIEDIQKLKDQIGLKLFNQNLGVVSKPARGSKEDYKRANKNRPREMSSKRTVRRFREVVTVAKVEPKRDPRFDPLCGDYDEKLFKDSYKFVSSIKNDELNVLKKQLGEEQDEERKEKIKFLITRMKNQARQEKQNETRDAEREIESKKTKELLLAGKKPYIMGKAKQKEHDLAAKYEKLKESGGLDNYIKKQTKKNATKDRIRLEKIQ